MEGVDLRLNFFAGTALLNSIFVFLFTFSPFAVSVEFEYFIDYLFQNLGVFLSRLYL